MKDIQNYIIEKANFLIKKHIKNNVSIPIISSWDDAKPGDFFKLNNGWLGQYNGNARKAGYMKVRFRCAPGTVFERVEVYAEMRKLDKLETDFDEKEVEVLSKIDEYITNHKIKQQKSNSSSYQTIGTVSKDFEFTPD